MENDIRYLNVKPQTMRLISCVLAMLLFVPAHAYSQNGYAYGKDHCYHFDAPKGWVMDNQAAAIEGVPMVFFPQGSTWQTAQVAMYTRPATPSSNAQKAARSIKEQADKVIAMYRDASENITAQRLRFVRSKSGTQGELWSFVGYSNKGTEFVVYFPGRRTINYFVAQVPKGANFEESKQVLLELAFSYREGTDCKPCSGRLSCTPQN
jgi:hypothetical protein